MSHDQNFKNLIVDYPREAIAFFAAAEAQAVDAGARIVPIREEQLKERLGEHFRELDVPLLVEWPDGRRAAVLFALEEETDTRRFSIHRLAHYCLDLAKMFRTERVVPVVIFLHRGKYAKQLRLGGDANYYLSFDYLACALFDTPAHEYLTSENLVARLNLPNMAYAPEEKVDVYAHAVRGLIELESHPDQREKYLDFIDIYAHLDENERIVYQQRYPQEAAEMTGFAERFIEQGRQQGEQQGMQQGMQRGMQKGEARVLVRQLTMRFGKLPELILQRIDVADAETLLRWSERVLTAQSLDEVMK